MTNQASKKANPNTKPRVRSRRGNTAERAMDIAESMFADRGFDGVTVKQIAEQLGIKEPSLYKHFASKEALYEAVLARGVQPLLDEIDSLRQQISNLNELLKMPADLLRTLAKHPDVARLLHRELASGSAGMHPVAADWFSRLLGHSRDFQEIASQQSNRGGSTWLLQPMAMMNMILGYFACGALYKQVAGGNVLDQATLEEQCRLVEQVYKTFLLAGS
jgi:AcrR family transcriptional regulator